MNTKINDLGARIQELRKELKLSQTDLATQIGVSKSQMIRYESKGGQPTADVLNKLAEVLGTTADYLLNGNMNEKASQTIKDTTILQRFKEIEELPPHEQSTIMEIVSAYIRDFKTKQAYIL